jgi:hypothetical protein
LSASSGAASSREVAPPGDQAWLPDVQLFFKYGIPPLSGTSGFWDKKSGFDLVNMARIFAQYTIFYHVINIWFHHNSKKNDPEGGLKWFLMIWLSEANRRTNFTTTLNTFLICPVTHGDFNPSTVQNKQLTWTCEHNINDNVRNYQIEYYLLCHYFLIVLQNDLFQLHNGISLNATRFFILKCIQQHTPSLLLVSSEVQRLWVFHLWNKFFYSKVLNKLPAKPPCKSSMRLVNCDGNTNLLTSSWEVSSKLN